MVEITFAHWRSAQEVSSHVIWKIETFINEWIYKIQDILCIRQWRLGPLESRQLGTSHSSPSHHQLPHHIFLNLFWQSEIFSLSKVILILEKFRSCRVPNLGCRGAESPGWFDVLPKNSARDVIRKQAHCHDEAAHHQLPRAAAFWIIWVVSGEGCASLMHNLMQICCCTCLVIFNVIATQYTAHSMVSTAPHWLVQ